VSDNSLISNKRVMERAERFGIVIMAGTVFGGHLED